MFLARNEAFLCLLCSNSRFTTLAHILLVSTLYLKSRWLLAVLINKFADFFFRNCKHDVQYRQRTGVRWIISRQFPVGVNKIFLSQHQDVTSRAISPSCGTCSYHVNTLKATKQEKKIIDIQLFSHFLFVYCYVSIVSVFAIFQFQIDFYTYIIHTTCTRNLLSNVSGA